MDNPEKKLRETPRNNGDLWFYFNGYGYWEDFLLIFKIVDEKIQPVERHYRGITEMDGYFIKDGIRMEVEFWDMEANRMLYKSTGKAEDAEKARGWARLIWEELEKRAMPRE